MFISFLLFALSVLCQIFFSNVLAAKNVELNTLYSKKDLLEKEISKLSFLESGLSQLSRVEEEAYKLGFIEMENTLFPLDLNAPVPLASLKSPQ